MNETVSLVLKSDSKGRVRMPEPQREALLDEYERSGLSAARFAAMVGVKYQTLITWNKKRRDQRAPGIAPKTVSAERAPALVARFVEVVPDRAAEPAPLAPALTLMLPGQATLQITHGSQTALAAQLLLALAKGGVSC